MVCHVNNDQPLVKKDACVAPMFVEMLGQAMDWQFPTANSVMHQHVASFATALGQ